MKRSFFGFAFFLLMAGNGEAITIQNGSFEVGTFDPIIAGHFVDINPGDLVTLPGWRVDTGKANWHQAVDFNVTPAQDGRKMIDLNDTAGGKVAKLSQDFVTTTSGLYVLTFYMSGPGKSFPNPRVVQVDVGDQVALLLSTPASDFSNTQWEKKEVTFKALTGLTTLSFSSTNNSGFWGPFIDNVSVAPVPIPAALPLFATGVAALVFVGRRKRKVKAMQAAA
jgi:choice-of-anchor C domain-containing protein